MNEVITEASLIKASKCKFMDEHGFTLLHTVRKMEAARKSGLLEQLYNKGYRANTGVWSAEEKQQLKQNMADFLDEFNLKSYKHIIHPISKEDCDFRKKSDFKNKICKYINRYGQCIENKCPNIFRDFTKPGIPKSEEEKYLFVKLVRKHGKNWTKIGHIMGRSGRDLYNFHQKIVDESSDFTKIWTKEDDERLWQAMQSDDQSLSWENVSDIIKTKSTQCGRRWKKLNEKMWNDSNNKHLVWLLNSLKVSCQSEIDWFKVKDAFSRKYTIPLIKKKFVLLQNSSETTGQPLPIILSKLNGVYKIEDESVNKEFPKVASKSEKEINSPLADFSKDIESINISEENPNQSKEKPKSKTNKNRNIECIEISEVNSNKNKRESKTKKVINLILLMSFLKRYTMLLNS